MARLEIVTGVLVAANALSNFGSLQSIPTHSISALADTTDWALPDEQILFPPHLFSDVKTSVAALKKILAREHKDRVGAINKMKHDHERMLETYEANNSRMERDNLQIESDIQAVTKANSALRRRATELVKANEILKTQLEGFSSNLSLAQEFAQESLAAATTNSSELQVLVELTQMDEVAHAVSKKQALLGAFDSPSTQLSFLSVVGDVRKRTTDDIMKGLATTLSTLSDEENTSQSLLKEAFEGKLLMVMSSHDAILTEQVLLNKTKTEAEEIHGRLSAAATYLSKIHNNLLARVKAIKAFAVNLGSSQSSTVTGHAARSQGTRQSATHSSSADRNKLQSLNRTLASLWSPKQPRIEP